MNKAKRRERECKQSLRITITTAQMTREVEREEYASRNGNSEMHNGNRLMQSQRKGRKNQFEKLDDFTNGI